MRRSEESLARTIKGQRCEELSFICLSDELWVCTVVIIVLWCSWGRTLHCRSLVF
jgi:hypothetical protein